MESFKITYKNTDSSVLLDAKSSEDAARKWAKRRYGREAVAIRTTGDAGKTGYFQPYTPFCGGLNSVGDPFHVF